MPKAFKKTPLKTKPKEPPKPPSGSYDWPDFLTKRRKVDEAADNPVNTILGTFTTGVFESYSDGGSCSGGFDSGSFGGDCGSF